MTPILCIIGYIVVGGFIFGIFCRTPDDYQEAGAMGLFWPVTVLIIVPALLGRWIASKSGE